MFVWRPKGVGLTERYRVFKAANAKPLKENRKFCAEMTLGCYARSNGYERIIAIAIAGLPQADDGSGIESATLLPCEDCRPFLANLPEVSSDTIILSVHNHTGLVEQRTLKEVLVLHGDKLPW
jgi:cytidine deaminase